MADRVHSVGTVLAQCAVVVVSGNFVNTAVTTSSPPRIVKLSIAAAFFLALASSLIYPAVSGNPASRFATIESLVERGTWQIDESTFNDLTVDKIQIAGATYSSKPPVLPLIGAGVYAAVHHLTGWTLVEQPRLTTTAVRLSLLVIPFVVFLVYFWRFLVVWMHDDRARVWLFVTVALASYLFGYSAKLNNHAPAAFLVFGSFYNAWMVVRAAGGIRSWLLAGIFAGAAVTFDLGAAPLVAGIGIYLLVHSPSRAILVFGVAALVPLGLNAWLNLQVSGSLRPIYLQHDLYNFQESYWRSPLSYDALDEPKWLYLVHMTIGHHGWLSMSPTFLLAGAGISSMWRQSQRREVLLLAGSALFVLVFYVFYTNNYGGGCGGMRWLIVTAPFWFLAVGKWLDANIGNARKRAAYSILAAIGAVHALPLVWDPWTRSPWHRLFQILGWGSV